eukprot:3914908-Pyramimonas_sp.AAC.1
MGRACNDYGAHMNRKSVLHDACMKHQCRAHGEEVCRTRMCLELCLYGTMWRDCGPSPSKLLGGAQGAP